MKNKKIKYFINTTKKTNIVLMDIKKKDNWWIYRFDLDFCQLISLRVTYSWAAFKEASKMKVDVHSNLTFIFVSDTYYF